MDTEYVKRLKEGIDLRELAGRFVELRGGHEKYGPCPVCGGDDRFHVDREKFFCRQCHPPGGKCDAVEFLMWKEGIGYGAAVDTLESYAPAGSPLAPAKKKVTPPDQDREWLMRAASLVDAAHSRLDQVLPYLEKRGIHEETARKFMVGYDARVRVPALDRYAPAVALPWFDIAGNVRAIRYRFIAPQFRQDEEGKDVGRPWRITSLFGSQFSGRLFGAKMLADHRETVVLVEGEINAMSVWQVTQDTPTNVLSIGSESAGLNDKQIAYLREYRTVLVWMDDEDRAASLAASIGDNCRHESFYQDANDLLVKGRLVDRLLEYLA